MRYLLLLLTIILIGCAPKVKLLHFWAPWCMTCAPELDELSKLHNLRLGESFEIVAVAALDTPESIKKFLSEKSYPFTMLEDTDGTLAQRYKITELPVTLIFDGEGRELQLFDPVTEEHTSRLIGARSWVSGSMTQSIDAILSR